MAVLDSLQSTFIHNTAIEKISDFIYFYISNHFFYFVPKPKIIKTNCVLAHQLSAS